LESLLQMHSLQNTQEFEGGFYTDILASCTIAPWFLNIYFSAIPKHPDSSDT
jgi:hypothetical protein